LYVVAAVLLITHTYRHTSPGACSRKRCILYTDQRDSHHLYVGKAALPTTQIYRHSAHANAGVLTLYRPPEIQQTIPTGPAAIAAGAGVNAADNKRCWCWLTRVFTG
jgi:hypothetical protein